MGDKEKPYANDEVLCITVQSLAKKLSIGLTGAYALCKQDGFPSRKINGRVVVDYAELLVWLKSQKMGGHNYD